MILQSDLFPDMRMVSMEVVVTSKSFSGGTRLFNGFVQFPRNESNILSDEETFLLEEENFSCRIKPVSSLHLISAVEQLPFQYH